MSKHIQIIFIAFFLIFSIISLPTTSFAKNSLTAAPAKVMVEKKEEGFFAKIASAIRSVVDSVARLVGETKKYFKIEKQDATALPATAIVTSKPIEAPVSPAATPARSSPSVDSPAEVSPAPTEPRAQVASPQTTATKNIDLSFAKSIDKVEQRDVEESQVVSALPAVKSSGQASAPTATASPATVHVAPRLESSPAAGNKIIAERKIESVPSAISIPIISATRARIVAAPITVTQTRTVRTENTISEPATRTRETTTQSTTDTRVVTPTTRQVTTVRDTLTPTTRQVTDVPDAKLMMPGDTSTADCVNDFESEIEGDPANISLIDDAKYAVVLSEAGRDRKIYAFNLCTGDVLECPATIDRTRRMSELMNVCVENKDKILPEEDAGIVQYIKRFDDHLVFIYDNVFYLTKGRGALVVDINPENTRDGKIGLHTQILRISAAGASDCTDCRMQFSLRDDRNTDVSALLDYNRSGMPLVTPPLRYSKVSIAGRGTDISEQITINMTVSDPALDKTISAEKTIAVLYQ